MRLSSVFRLGVKELWGLARDPVLVLLILYAFSFSVSSSARSEPETLNRAAIAIVDEDNSPLSQRIADAFYPPHFTDPRMITLDEVDERLDAGIDTFVLDIPPNFQRDVLADREPDMQLNVDATRMTQAFSGAGYVETIVTQEVTEFLARVRETNDQPVTLALRAKFNQQLDPMWFGAINALISSISMLSIILGGAALIREREHGTIEHMLVMPLAPVEILASKVWSMGLVVFLATVFCLRVIIQGQLQVPIPGSIGLFYIGAALQLFATTSLGFFLATVAGSMPQFALLMILTLLPMQMLSGGGTPRENMPEFVQTIMLAAPDTHFVMIAQAVLFRGAGLDVIWPQFLWLAGIGGILFYLALRKFRKFLQ
ncbi:MAG: hypothetical protein CML66_12235 [Rhodobacteraceae bacterium]|nr:hypothetical protein [Paracoccaceae bacterium]MAY48101.1 hypothetical protein [Paracoccaceae bacterium]